MRARSVGASGGGSGAGSGGIATAQTRPAPLPLRRGREETFDLPDELARRDGFGDVAIEAGGEHVITVAHHGQGCHRHQWNLAQPRIGLEPLGHRVAVHVGQMHVAEDEFQPRLRLGARQTFLAVLGGESLVSEGLEQIAHQRQIVRVVLDDQNPRHGSRLPSGSA